MKKIKAALTALGMALLAGCTNLGMGVVNGLALVGPYSLERDIAYGDNAQTKLDVYSPKDTGPHPVVIFYYGGCWGACTSADKSDYRFVAQALVARGVVVVMPDFRQYPEVNFAPLMEDASLAVKWVQDNIAGYGGDPSKIVLSGHSSGAHIASMLALDTSWLTAVNANAPKGFVGLAGPYDFLPFTADYQRTLFGPSENYLSSQPIAFAKQGKEGSKPAALLLHGGADVTVGAHNYRNLEFALRSAGNTASSKEYEGIGHIGIVSALSVPLRSRAPVAEDMINFVNKVTAEAP